MQSFVKFSYCNFRTCHCNIVKSRFKLVLALPASFSMAIGLFRWVTNVNSISCASFIQITFLRPVTKGARHNCTTKTFQRGFHLQFSCYSRIFILAVASLTNGFKPLHYRSSTLTGSIFVLSFIIYISFFMTVHNKFHILT